MMKHDVQSIKIYNLTFFTLDWQIVFECSIQPILWLLMVFRVWGKYKHFVCSLENINSRISFQCIYSYSFGKNNKKYPLFKLTWSLYLKHDICSLNFTFWSWKKMKVLNVSAIFGSILFTYLHLLANAFLILRKLLSSLMIEIPTSLCNLFS